MKLTCPICRRRMEIDKIADLPSFPFCSERCKLVDLGRWIDGDYAIAAPPTNEPEDSDEKPVEAVDEADEE